MAQRTYDVYARQRPQSRNAHRDCDKHRGASLNENVESRLVAYTARLFREDHGRFATQRHRRVLIYWPHGLGDWVHLGYVLPTLEPSNRYWLTRYGDDFVALARHDRVATPLFSGIQSTRNRFGNAAYDRHLGVPYRRIDGRIRTVYLTERLAEAARRAEIDTILWSDYPDPAGRSPFPFHTKARHLIKQLVAPERYADVHLDRALPNSLDFTPDPAITRLVAERLSQLCAPGEHLTIVQAGGQTAPAKSWPLANLTTWLRAFTGGTRRRVIILGGAPPERLAGVATFAELFGELTSETPFASLLTALLSRTDLAVGVPAGPFHLAMARRDIPCLGIWRVHHPLDYEEPHTTSIHCVSASVVAAEMQRRGRRPPPMWLPGLVPLTTEDPPIEVLLAAAEGLITGRTQGFGEPVNSTAPAPGDALGAPSPKRP